MCARFERQVRVTKTHNIRLPAAGRQQSHDDASRLNEFEERTGASAKRGHKMRAIGRAYLVAHT